MAPGAITLDLGSVLGSGLGLFLFVLLGLLGVRVRPGSQAEIGNRAEEVPLTKANCILLITVSISLVASVVAVLHIAAPLENSPKAVAVSPRDSHALPDRAFAENRANRSDDRAATIVLRPVWVDEPYLMDDGPLLDLDGAEGPRVQEHSDRTGADVRLSVDRARLVEPLDGALVGHWEFQRQPTATECRVVANQLSTSSSLSIDATHRGQGLCVRTPNERFVYLWIEYVGAHEIRGTATAWDSAGSR